MIEIGMTGTFTTRVNADNTAKTMKSGSLDVFATPALVAAMEAAAVDALKDSLSDTDTTVGSSISITHQAPSVIGAYIKAEAVVTEVSGKQIKFSVSACDEVGIIGEGEHTRVVVDAEKFMNKAKGRSKTNVD